MTLASVHDVESRWRTLSMSEVALASTLIEDASALLRAKVPGLDDAIAAGDVSAELVRARVVAMVVRVLRNPDGIRQRTVGDVSVTQDGDGMLTLTDGDLDGLAPGLSSRAFTIRPSGA
jgi:hypothetical protein